VIEFDNDTLTYEEGRTLTADKQILNGKRFYSNQRQIKLKRDGKRSVKKVVRHNMASTSPREELNRSSLSVRKPEFSTSSQSRVTPNVKTKFKTSSRLISEVAKGKSSPRRQIVVTKPHGEILPPGNILVPITRTQSVTERERS